MTNATIAPELRRVVRIAYEGCGRAICLPALDVAAHEVSTAWEGEGWYRVGWRNEAVWYELANDLAIATYMEVLDADHMDEVGVNYLGDGETY